MGKGRGKEEKGKGRKVSPHSLWGILSAETFEGKTVLPY